MRELRAHRARITPPLLLLVLGSGECHSHRITMKPQAPSIIMCSTWRASRKYVRARRPLLGHDQKVRSASPIEAHCRILCSGFNLPGTKSIWQPAILCDDSFLYRVCAVSRFWFICVCAAFLTERARARLISHPFRRTGVPPATPTKVPTRR